MKPSERRSLTGLRWFAALGVYFFHFDIPIWASPWNQNLANNGSLGVPFFFVLSGFVLTYRYEHGTASLARYFLSRLARIAPLYYVALFVAIAVQSTQQETPLNYTMIQHLLVIQSWGLPLPGLSFNGPGWTISVEVIFYLLFPFLIRFSTRLRKTLTGSLGLMTLGLLMSIIPFAFRMISYGRLIGSENGPPWELIWPTKMPLHYLGLFVVGIGSSAVARNIDPRDPKRLIGWLTDTTMALALAVLMLVNINDTVHPMISLAAKFWLFGLPFGLIMILLSIDQTSFSGKLLGSNLFHFLGKASFSFYIFHFPINSCITTLNIRLSPLSMFLVILGCSIGAHLIIEQPLQKLIMKRPIKLL